VWEKLAIWRNGLYAYCLENEDLWKKETHCQELNYYLACNYSCLPECHMEFHEYITIYVAGNIAGNTDVVEWSIPGELVDLNGDIFIGFNYHIICNTVPHGKCVVNCPKFFM
jgi:hypothetical protein